MPLLVNSSQLSQPRGRARECRVVAYGSPGLRYEADAAMV